MTLMELQAAATDMDTAIKATVPYALGTFLLILAFSFFMLFRNHLVYRYRNRKIEQASKMCQARIDRRDPDPLYPFSVYETVSYDQMMYKFWKPLSSFYAGTILSDNLEQGGENGSLPKRER